MKDPSALLCVSPSSMQQAVLRSVAETEGLAWLACSSEEEALQVLERGPDLMVMAVAHQLDRGDSFHVMESARLSLRYAVLPIAFILSEYQPALAYQAFGAGATEIFLTNEYPALANFVHEWAVPQEQGNLPGRALVVDDSRSHALYVEGLLHALGMTVDVANDIDTALELYRQHDYLIMVIDIVLKDSRSGISLVRQIRTDHVRHEPILVMSGFDDMPRRLQALRSGADDFIRKPFAAEEFIWRIKKILQDYAWQDQARCVSDSPGKLADSHTLVQLLSPRERQICSKILKGDSDRKIAAALGISYWTVRSHIQQIFCKTGMLNRQELMAAFIHAGDLGL